MLGVARLRIVPSTATRKIARHMAMQRPRPPAVELSDLGAGHVKHRASARSAGGAVIRGSSRLVDHNDAAPDRFARRASGCPTLVDFPRHLIE